MSVTTVQMTIIPTSKITTPATHVVMALEIPVTHVRAKVPIFVAEPVMEEAGILPEPDVEEGAEGEEPEQLDAFKDFVDTLDFDDFESDE